MNTMTKSLPKRIAKSIIAAFLAISVFLCTMYFVQADNDVQTAKTEIVEIIENL